MRIAKRQKRLARYVGYLTACLRYFVVSIGRISIQFVVSGFIVSTVFASGQVEAQAQAHRETPSRPPVYSGQNTSSPPRADQNRAPSFSGYDEVAYASTTPTVATDTITTTEASTVVSSEVDPVYRLDINTATAEQLDDLLPGIGPEKARRIIAWIAANGPFQTVDQLTQVSGIGPKTLELIRPYVRVGDAVSTLNSQTKTHSIELQTKLAVQKIVAAAQQDAISVTGLTVR